MIQIFIQFFETLATAHTAYVPLIISCLLNEFVDITPVDNGKRTEVQFYVHWALQRVLEFVPTANTILVQLMRENFPHKSADRREQISYVYNLIRISDYVQHIRGDVLSLCIERVVKIDVATLTLSISDEIGGNTIRTGSIR